MSFSFDAQGGTLGLAREERQRRLRAVQEHLVARGIDLLLVVGRENLIYPQGTDPGGVRKKFLAFREEF